MLYLDLVYEAGKAGMNGNWIYTINYHKVPGFVYHICKWWMDLEFAHPYVAWTVWIMICVLGVMVISYIVKDGLPEFRKMVTDYKTRRQMKLVKCEVSKKEES